MDMDPPSGTLRMWIIAGGAVLVLAVVLGFLQATVDGTISYDKSDTALYCVHHDQCKGSPTSRSSRKCRTPCRIWPTC